MRRRAALPLRVATSRIGVGRRSSPAYHLPIACTPAVWSATIGEPWRWQADRAAEIVGKWFFLPRQQAPAPREAGRRAGRAGRVETQGTTKFGKYELIELVARGGMAEIYRARTVGLGGFEAHCAIKKILPHLNEKTPFQFLMD